MFKITEYVNSSSIWPNTKDYEDKGYIEGYVRGYNIEVTTHEGFTDWLSCSYIYGDPSVEFDDDFHKWYFDEHRWTPTGRVCFRGYGIEHYDFEERDTYIEVVDI